LTFVDADGFSLASSDNCCVFTKFDSDSCTTPWQSISVIFRATLPLGTALLEHFGHSLLAKQVLGGAFLLLAALYFWKEQLSYTLWCWFGKLGRPSRSWAKSLFICILWYMTVCVYGGFTCLYTCVCSTLESLDDLEFANEYFTWHHLMTCMCGSAVWNKKPIETLNNSFRGIGDRWMLWSINQIWRRPWIGWNVINVMPHEYHYQTIWTTIFFNRKDLNRRDVEFGSAPNKIPNPGDHAKKMFWLVLTSRSENSSTNLQTNLAAVFLTPWSMSFVPLNFLQWE